MPFSLIYDESKTNIIITLAPNFVLGIILQFINNWGLCIPKWGFLLETLYIPRPFFLLKISYLYQFVFPKNHSQTTLVLIKCEPNVWNPFDNCQNTYTNQCYEFD
jgi:hypothetical protein